MQRVCYCLCLLEHGSTTPAGQTSVHKKESMHRVNRQQRSAEQQSEIDVGDVIVFINNR